MDFLSPLVIMVAGVHRIFLFRGDLVMLGGFLCLRFTWNHVLRCFWHPCPSTFEVRFALKVGRPSLRPGRCAFIMYIIYVLLIRERATWFPVEEVESSWCDCDCPSLTANRRGEELMELSTTNGHITIDYLFIYQPHLFSSGGAFSP